MQVKTMWLCWVYMCVCVSQSWQHVPLVWRVSRRTEKNCVCVCTALCNVCYYIQHVRTRVDVCMWGLTYNLISHVNTTNSYHEAMMLSFLLNKYLSNKMQCLDNALIVHIGFLLILAVSGSPMQPLQVQMIWFMLWYWSTTFSSPHLRFIFYWSARETHKSIREHYKNM